MEYTISELNKALSELPAATIQARNHNVKLQATPAYKAWLAEVKYDLALGDGSPSAVVQRRTNGGMTTADHLWQKVLEQAGE